MILEQKKERGQYYTTVNPFNGVAFDEWYNMVPKNEKVVEPFAGAGNLFSFIDADWVGYDIEPTREGIIQRDVLKDFPKGYKVGITNPPYLAKNAAKRLKIDYPYKLEDLYLESLDKMLENLDWVAAIIPSTFYHTKKFRDRLFAWDKQDRTLFSDTTAPAGVAYFGPDTYNTRLFVNGTEISPVEFDNKSKVNIQMNVAHGNYVMNGIDLNKHDNIYIHDNVEEFDRKKFLKDTSRNYCLFYCEHEIDIDKTNENIKKWRTDTNDFYLTSFKSTGLSGKYRKRLGFNQLQNLIILKESLPTKNTFNEIFE